MRPKAGFTLVEMAVALVVVTLLLGGLLVPFVTQVEQRRVNETISRLEEIKEALIGYALANERFPCPASATSNGVESFAAGGNATNGACSNFFNGFVPAVTLGISSVDANGYAIDAWGLTQNRIHYAVADTTINTIGPPPAPLSFPFTRTGGMKLVGMGNMSVANLLHVCTTGTGVTATDCSGPATRLTRNALVVLYSVGKNAATGGTGTDEAANPNPASSNNDRVYVSRAYAEGGSAGGEFDDIVTWLSSNILFNRMIVAGKLP
ncbi:MAG: prepilin-type N-terminal cleavage/methylation domain-containing protein [Burkholderiales bacterium]